MNLWHRFRSHLWTMLGTSGWPGMDRRQWWWRSSLIGYRSTMFPLALLFVPHVAMIILLTLSLPLIAIGWLSGQQVDGEAWVMGVVGTLFSIPFWLFVPIILGRRATIIDTRGGTVSEWRGLALPFLPIVPLMRRHHPLERYTAVEVSRERSGGGMKKGTEEVYQLRLSGNGASDIVVVETKRLLTARRIAENLARRCGLTLRDKTSDETIVRHIAQLDLPLVDTAPSGPVPAAPVLPPDATLRLPARGARPWEAVQPRPPFSGWRALRLTFLCGALAWVATIAHPRYEATATRPPPPAPVERPSARWQPPSPWPARLAQIAAPGLVVVQYGAGLAALAALISFSGRMLLRPYGWRITVDARGLCVARSGLCGALWPHRRRQSLKELEELRLDQRDPHWRLLAISDRRLVPIGSTFTHAEAVALHQELVLALRAEAAPPLK